MLTFHRAAPLLLLAWVGAASAAEDPRRINFEAAYADGVNAFVAHRYLLAEQSLEDAVMVGSDPAAWMFKGLAERALGKHAEAQESFHQAASLRAAGASSRISLDRAIERVQGDFRLYLDDVEKYYVRTGHTPGEVISGASAPIVPLIPDSVQPALPVPPKPYSPAPPAPALDTPDTIPPPPSPTVPVQTPPGEPLRVTVAKPVAVFESSPGVPAVIAGAPVYPPPGVPYAAGRFASVVATGYVLPAPTLSCCGGVGAWLPASWSSYVSPYYSSYDWWSGYPYASSW